MRLAMIFSFGLLVTSLGVLEIEPSLAGNKFEIISSGVGGVHAMKRDHLKIVLFVISGALFLSTLLAVFVPHKNPLFINFANWRQSAVLMCIGGALMFVGALML